MKYIFFLAAALSALTFETLLKADTHTSTGQFRNYWIPLSQKDAKDIQNITNTLGKGSLVKIANSRSSLKKAGQRVDHVHPLNFLYAIFSDEEAKAAIHALQKRDWIFGEFFSGVNMSFKEETARNNVKQDMIDDFCNKLSLNKAQITALIDQRAWKDLVLTLIEVVPRKTETDRYNW